MHNSYTDYVQHIPVLEKEITAFLRENISANGLHIDATLGLGGHAKSLLESGFHGMILGVEWDRENLAVAQERLAPWSAQIQYAHGNFRNMRDIVHGHAAAEFDSILFDFGISSVHVDISNKGFSFQQEGPLDMRYSPEGESAYDFVNFRSEKELSDILWEYGEERLSRHIAAEILRRRKQKKIQTTTELASLVADVYRHRGRHQSGRHPATRTFQALRIAVNDELGNIETGLRDSIDLAKEDAFFLAISYHSLEDRLIKTIFREKAREGTLQLINKRVIVPAEEERARNPRSRSAKLRIGRKLLHHP